MQLGALQLDEYKAAILTTLLHPASELLVSNLNDNQPALPMPMDTMRYTLQESHRRLDPIETRLGSAMPPSITSSPAKMRRNFSYRSAGHLPPEQSSSDTSSRDLGKAHLMTTAVLQECGHKLNQTLSRLYVHMEEIDMELSVSSPPAEENNLAIHNDHAGSKGSLF
ncbi:hypothetical protein MKZ38_004385 [Zalerion maritima]|uniref:Uncharacterized protein n=1 Tax=Zalerion maritima TaxID=339359 RepID=A0AAD5RSM1_9PEZI|nr:hypothetical protein MKZ38_004385 [Zalerion maritima]